MMQDEDETAAAFLESDIDTVLQRHTHTFKPGAKPGVRGAARVFGCSLAAVGRCALPACLLFARFCSLVV